MLVAVAWATLLGRRCGSPTTLQAGLGHTRTFALLTAALGTGHAVLVVHECRCDENESPSQSTVSTPCRAYLHCMSCQDHRFRARVDIEAFGVVAFTGIGSLCDMCLVWPPWLHGCPPRGPGSPFLLCLLSPHYPALPRPPWQLHSSGAGSSLILSPFPILSLWCFHFTLFLLKQSRLTRETSVLRSPSTSRGCTLVGCHDLPSFPSLAYPSRRWGVAQQ